MATAARNGNGATTTEELAAQVATLRTDLEKLSRMMGDAAQDRVRSARAQAEDAAHRLKDGAVHQAEHLAEQARAARAGAEDTIRQNPNLAIAIAGGIGFLVGLMVARR